jgi:hypothetical protein
MLIQNQVGPIATTQSISPGLQAPARAGQLGDLIVSELHGRFYEQAYRGSLFKGGSTLTAINAATFTSATTGATATPLATLYNPSGSTVNCVLLQATLAITTTALTATGGGPFVWMISAAAGPISTGSQPFNMRTLTATGAQGRYVQINTALTGMSGTLAVAFGSALGGGSSYNTSFVGTAAGMQTVLMGFVENFDGQIIVPPNAVLTLMATTTPVAQSATTSLLWEEVPL